MSNRDMSTPGDHLAKGGKSATYRVPSNSNVQGCPSGSLSFGYGEQ